MNDHTVSFAPERAADFVEVVNACIADWPHCRPITRELLDYITSRPEFRPEHVLMHYSANRCDGVLHGELHDGTGHIHLLAIAGNRASDVGERLIAQWEGLARTANASRIVSPTWRASLFYGGYVLGNEPYHPHWATDGTDAYLRSGFRISHPAIILARDLEQFAIELPPHDYRIVEVNPPPEHEAITFGFHAIHGGQKAAHCYGRLYPHLLHPESRKPTGQIGNVTTEPAHRNRGLARAMVSMSLARLRLMGCGEVLIATGLDNAPALRAYERCGFVRRHFIMEWSKGLK